MHVPVLVATIAMALVAAFACGYVAVRLRLPAIVGYLVAGIVIGPHTPGFVGDVKVATDLAEIGVALLMFGVGLHFAPRELMSVRSVAVPGALVQSTVATLLGGAAGVALGWGWVAGIVFGLAVSVASTVVLIRGLSDRRLLDSVGGHVAVGWLLVEDLLTVGVLVMLPHVAAMASGASGASGATWAAFGLALLKVAVMAAGVVVVGARAVPWLLERVALTRSREMFTLAVLSVALGIACAAAWGAGASLALGAFLGGLVVGQSELSHRAAADSIPLRDAFAVLFFVSVGMLFDPGVLVREPMAVLVTLGIILVAKPLAALGIMVVLRQSLRDGLTVAVGLAQVGEFSFIVASLGVELGLIPRAAQDSVLAGAIASIALNPLLFRAAGSVERWVARSRPSAPREPAPAAATAAATGHVVLCGAGRVGTVVARMVADRGWSSVVVELDARRARKLRRRGMRVVEGDAGSALVLEHAGVASAGLLVVTFTDAVAARLVVDQAREMSASLPIVVRVGSRSERDRYEAMPGVHAVMGEFETAVEMVRRTLVVRGASALEAEAVILQLRRADRGESPPATGVRLVETEVPPGSRAEGRTLADIAPPASVRVVVVRRDGDEIVAVGTTVIEAGDRLVVLADDGGLAALRELL